MRCLYWLCLESPLPVCAGPSHGGSAPCSASPALLSVAQQWRFPGATAVHSQVLVFSRLHLAATFNRSITLLLEIQSPLYCLGAPLWVFLFPLQLVLLSPLRRCLVSPRSRGAHEGTCRSSLCPHLKCPLYEDVCIYICHLDLSRRLQTRAFDCLLDISICMCLIGISNITCPWDPSRLPTCLFPWALVSRGPLLGDCFRGLAQGVVGVKELLEAEGGERRQSGSKIAWVIA